MKSKKTKAIFLVLFMVVPLFASMPLVTAQGTVVSIEDVTVEEGESKVVPIMIENVTIPDGVGVSMIHLEYNKEVVIVSDVADGDFDSTISYIDNEAGITKIASFQIMSAGLTGDVVVAYTNLTAVGSLDDTSVLNLTVETLVEPDSVTSIPHTVRDGTFMISLPPDTTPPSVTNPTATPSSILADGTTTSQLNVTVTDDSGVASVTIDLSAIGGSATEVMTAMGDNVYSAETTAVAGTTPGTYNLPVNATDIYGNSNTSVSIPLTVTEPEPDLTVESITPNCEYLFGNESNNVSATIKNIGTADAGAFSVFFAVGTYRERVRLTGGLSAGESTDVTVTDPTQRTAGESVTISVMADCNAEVSELNETNNVLSQDETVVNNGYKGKRYTGGEDINTWKTFELNGDLLYSVGDSYYLSAYSYPDWTTYTVNWTATDLPVPEGASVEEARLYVPYTWDKADVVPDEVRVTFNGEAQTLAAHYSDEKGWATSYPYGMLAYNVTTNFNVSGNTAVLTNSYPGGGNVSIRGMLLVVIYADDSELERQIFVNEEFDLLFGGTSKCTTPEEATAYAPFAGAIDASKVANATLITVAPGAGPTEGELIFNEQIWTDVWSFAGATQIGIDERDVTTYLNEADNEVGFQSSADYMEASNAILVVEYMAQISPTVSISTDKTTYHPGDIMHVGLEVTNPGDDLPVRFAVWLEKPDGGIYVLTFTSLTLPAGLEYSNPDFAVFTLPRIPSGTYTWNAAIIEPYGPIEFISHDTAEWSFGSSTGTGTEMPTEDISRVLEQAKTTIVIDFGG